MIHLDPIIIEFVSKNYLALTLFLFLLKGIAKMTPWATDDKIAGLLVGALRAVKPKKNDGTGTPEK